MYGSYGTISHYDSKFLFDVSRAEALAHFTARRSYHSQEAERCTSMASEIRAKGKAAIQDDEIERLARFMGMGPRVAMGREACTEALEVIEFSIRRHQRKAKAFEFFAGHLGSEATVKLPIEDLVAFEFVSEGIS